MSEERKGQAQIGTAVHRGAEDYMAGRHSNPYDYETEGELFRAWIEGYNAAKACDEWTQR